jgi:mannose-6-phosphate isomerase-like protein (cupin superfamily)
MQVFDFSVEQVWDPVKHVEKVLGRIGDGDVTIACWEPGQVSPNHLHPNATEIYFCVQGGGVMRTPDRIVDITPGSFVVHPPGELHEYTNGPTRTVLFRVRYGKDFSAPHQGLAEQSELARTAGGRRTFRVMKPSCPVRGRSTGCRPAASSRPRRCRWDCRSD